LRLRVILPILIALPIVFLLIFLNIITISFGKLGLSPESANAVTTATQWLIANLRARLHRSIIKARVAGKHPGLKRGKFTLSGSFFLQGVV